ncbi:MAG TPA: alpha/beta hydrolase [Myxococcales bacterium]|nr:alpha/beta hydrolase [Myxococcales bacterium]
MPAHATIERKGAPVAPGIGRLAVDAVLGLTGVVESMHGTISRKPFPVGTAPETRTRGITRLVYQGIRSVTQLVGGGLEVVLPLLPEPATTPRGQAVVSALNGIVGGHLEASGNPLAIPMRFRSAGAPAGGRIVVLIHGLCMNDRQWRRQGHDHGEALAKRLGLAPVYLRYNTGRHVSTNGRELAARLEALVSSWPAPVREIAIVGHSMGGLVARSACHYARLAGHRWVERLSALAFLGTPHHGAPLERAGNLLDLVLEMSPYAAPLARVGGNRGAGITDLRFGNLLDEDWNGQPPRHRHDPRTPVPLPAGVRCFAVAASRSQGPGARPGRLLGDGLVPVDSALGRHRDPRFALAFPAERQHVLYCSGHMDLLGAPEIADRLAGWLS